MKINGNELLFQIAVGAAGVLVAGLIMSQFPTLPGISQARVGYRA